MVLAHIGACFRGRSFETDPLSTAIVELGPCIAVVLHLYARHGWPRTARINSTEKRVSENNHLAHMLLRVATSRWECQKWLIQGWSTEAG